MPEAGQESRAPELRGLVQVAKAYSEAHEQTRMASAHQTETEADYLEVAKTLEGQNIAFTGPVEEVYERDENGLDWLVAFDADKLPQEEVTLTNQLAVIEYVRLESKKPNDPDPNPLKHLKAVVILLDEVGDNIGKAMINLSRINWRLAEEPLEELAAAINNGTAEPFDDPRS